MAQKKNTYKKSNDRTLTYIIVGFGAVIVSLVLGLLIYNAFDDSVDYDSFDHIYNYYDIPAQDEETYLVYYYGEGCEWCKTIKNDVLDFSANNPQGIKVYLIESGNSSNWPTDSETGYPRYGTPTLFTVVGNAILDVSPGATDVMETIESIQDGTYPYFN